MERIKPGENAAAGGRQLDADEAAVGRDDFFADEIALRGPVDQPDDGVVALLQEFGKLGDVGGAASRESSNAEHQLMLLRRDAAGACRLFAEAQEHAEVVAKLGESPGDSAAGPRGTLEGHALIISRRDMFSWAGDVQQFHSWCEAA